MLFGAASLFSLLISNPPLGFYYFQNRMNNFYPRKAQGAHLSATNTGRPARSGRVFDRKRRSEVIEPMAPGARQFPS
ncbi:hypothetical protein BKP45_13755 [Anaerobacillus alkalidiazotrophicus]|uniref:Uncharacterized protein n=1 Tax=Anaerobacillus alkalidiazotrophicus TaxID=472963 RepID=A0A1S2M3W4_9BACI|nr:hypothetical protein BKP45_13755 [Anaerobacillus alkalidiazotrophicus]